MRPPPTARLAWVAMMGLGLAGWACGARTGAPASRPPLHSEPSTPSVTAAPHIESSTPSTSLSPLPAATDDIDDAACQLLPGSDLRPQTVALTDEVSAARAPHPSNTSEQLLFRQLYETLIRVDCEGRARPGLAESWRPDARGQSWIITLRSNARFADGTPVTTSDIVASWGREGHQDELTPRARRHVESVIPVTNRVVGVTLRRMDTDAPLALADPDLAIAKRSAGSPWPLGSRPYRVLDERGRSLGGRAAGTIRLVVSPIGEPSAPSVGSPRASSIRFLVDPGGDPRDLLDQGADLLLSRDPAVLDYAKTLPPFTSVPLSWGRTYVFLSPRRTRATPALTATQRQAFANDAVRGEARGAEEPFHWESATDCGLTHPAGDRPQVSSPRIVYEQGDAAARDLAERFVGLANTTRSQEAAILATLGPDNPGQTFHRAIGLTGDALVSAIRTGTDAGYIVSLDRWAFVPCQEITARIEDADWMHAAAMVPLVDTRLRALVRRGRSGLAIEWDGGLLIAFAEGGR